VYREQEQNYCLDELIKENDNLKRLLLINHDFTFDMETQIKLKEDKLREEELY
jgi:hypothetical protein